jgi:RNA polymerase sigma factor (sigma-70 family)
MFDFKAALAAPDTLKTIDQIADRLFGDPNDALACSVYVLDELRRDGCRRLASFKGRCRPETFLYGLIRMLAFDYCRRIRGRREVPVAVRRLGPWAPAAYKLICWERFSVDEAYEILCARQEWQGADVAEFERCCQPVLAAPCKPGFCIQTTDPETTPEPVSPQPNPLEALLDHLERRRRLRAMQIIRKVAASLEDNDRRLLELFYGEDLSAAAAARLLDIPGITARRRLAKLRLKLRSALHREGIREW